MASLQNFYTSRDNNANANTYVGQLDRLWYNPGLNSIYVSDGNTPGGIPVGLATAANAIFTNITVNGEVLGNLQITGNISAAANGKIGGITPGPGVLVGNTGILTIDSANLPVSFGNFFANTNILSIVNENENMILQTQGSAEIQLIGNIGFYKPDGTPPNTANRYFRASDDGQIQILVSNADPLLGAVEIVGTTSGNVIEPGIAGAMLHVTGQLNTVNRLYFDGNGDYVSVIGRRWNGNVASPTQVLSGQDVLRINATAATNAGVGNVAHAQIHVSALEDQTTTAQGSEISFIVTPLGQSAANRVEVANVTVANGVTATKFTTSGTVSAIGNIVAGNVNSRVTLSAGIASQAPLLFTAGVLETTPSIGAMNYDGTVFYATPQYNERGLIVTEQLFIPNADYPLLNQTAVQNLFGAITTVSSNTRYAYRIMSVVYKVSNNISLQYAMGGNAVVAKHTYETSTTATAALATATAPLVTKNVVTTGFSTPVTVSGLLNGTGYYGLTVTGTINVTTAGTWYPEIGFTGLPGVGANVFAGSSIEIWPIGPTGANVAIGNWS